MRFVLIPFPLATSKITSYTRFLSTLSVERMGDMKDQENFQSVKDAHPSSRVGGWVGREQRQASL